MAGRVGLLEVHYQIDVGDEVGARVIVEVHDQALAVAVRLDGDVIHLHGVDAIDVESVVDGGLELGGRLTRVRCLGYAGQGVVDGGVIHVDRDQLEGEDADEADHADQDDPGDHGQA